jgi:hypothetical protein
MSGDLRQRLAVPIPKRLRTRPLDTRGYPVPWIVFVDDTGTPQFTVNDIRRLRQTRSKNLCGLCGNRMEKTMWFIGGPKCFTHEHGAFVDPPNHYECAEYALRVCPFLAAPSYVKRVDLEKLRQMGLTSRDIMVVHYANPGNRPDCFGLGATRAYDYIDDPGVYTIERWDYLEWWRDGATTNAPDGQTPCSM